MVSIKGLFNVRRLLHNFFLTSFLGLYMLQSGASSLLSVAPILTLEISGLAFFAPGCPNCSCYKSISSFTIFFSALKLVLENFKSIKDMYH